MDGITQRIAEHAAGLTFGDLPDAVVERATQHVVDALACAMGGFHGEAATAGRAVAFGGAPNAYAGRILGHAPRAAADTAAFVNAAMVRNLDYNDTFPGGHPSDCIGALLALAESADANGQELLTSVVAAYEVFVRLIRSTRLRDRGWDQGLVVGIATAAGLGRLLRLPVDEVANAVSIAAVSNVSLRVTRMGELSLWKGAATPFAARNGTFATLLAAEDMTGPSLPFEGVDGVWDKITDRFDIEPFPNEGGAFALPRVRFKFWPAEYSAQAAVWAALELRTWGNVADLVSVRIGVHEAAWKDIGSGEEKWDPQTRETADHSLPYVFARALVDGDLTVASFDDEAVLDPALRPVMQKVTVHADDAANKAWPEEVRLRLEATDRQGRSKVVEIVNPRGHERNPMTVEETAAKFRTLSGDILGERGARAALARWWDVRNAESLGPLLDALVPEDVK